MNCNYCNDEDAKCIRDKCSTCCNCGRTLKEDSETKPTLEKAMELLRKITGDGYSMTEFYESLSLIKAYDEQPEAEQPTTFGATQCFKCFCDVKECTCGVIHKPKGDDCSIESIVYFGTKLTNEDQERIEGFLAHKHNIQGNLPDSHPYKDAPPSVTQPEAPAASEPKRIDEHVPCRDCKRIIDGEWYDRNNGYCSVCRTEQPEQNTKRIEPIELERRVKERGIGDCDKHELRYLVTQLVNKQHELIERVNELLGGV